MDAAGKDSTIEHVMSGVNPQGCRVYSFKHPTPIELRHHFLWRHQVVLPGKGMMAIFNRSHYENVLICKVHPHYVLNEEIPSAQSIEDISPEFWDQRYRQIRDFERTLTESGTIILKFFLHLSPEEQKRRFLKRLQNPEKQWKFSFGDIEERKKWFDYQQAYSDALEATSTDYAPWFVIPADNKRYMRWAVCNIINEQLEQLDLQYPEVPPEEQARMEEMKKELRKKDF
jgi:PPK2 family polyphosphate:nucleotide phosphotransferase